MLEWLMAPRAKVRPGMSFDDLPERGGLTRPKAPRNWWYANEARHQSEKVRDDPEYARRIVGHKWWHVMKNRTVAEKMGLWGSEEEIAHYRDAGWPVPAYTEVEKRTERERIRQEILDNIANLRMVPGSDDTILRAMAAYEKVWGQAAMEKRRRKYAAQDDVPSLSKVSALWLLVDKFGG